MGSVNLGGIADSLKIHKGQDLIKYGTAVPIQAQVRH